MEGNIVVTLVEGRPRKKFKRGGGQPKYDQKIRAAVDTGHLRTKNLCEKETIRRRARTLGYTVKTSAAKGGGWNIEIFTKK